MLVILGGGYTGRFIYAQAMDAGLMTRVTSRTPETHLNFAHPDHRLEFDLEQTSTWKNIPKDADLIWCFPATPLSAVSAFARAVLPAVTRLVVLGSTSAYEISDASAERIIDETAPIDRGRPRVAGEEYLRTEWHALVLRVAGIYGPGRNVLDWIRRGKVGRSQRWVNLIHVEDVAAICLSALGKGRSGDVYNVGDGRPRRWSDICDEAKERWHVVPTREEGGTDQGKRLSIDKLMRDFHYRFQHADLYRALQEIETATSAQANALPPP